MQPETLADNQLRPCEAPLPSFAQWRERLIAAEQGTGWLDECIDAGRFLAVSRELADVLSRILHRLAGGDRVLEVCAGSGGLARALVARGVDVEATDADPPEATTVLRLSAQAALKRFRPKVVLGVFVPHDASVDEAVLACPSVRHYVVVNARLGGALGSASLWKISGWQYEPLDAIRRWVLTRHDVWLGSAGMHRDEILQHGEVWHFARASPAPPARERSSS